MLLKFGLVSGLGWLIDFSLFSVLCAFGMHAGIANAIAASIAVTLVFFVSLRPIFRDKGDYLAQKLISYWIYQVVAVFLASAAVGLLVAEGLNPLVAKIAVTPVTFLANFLFMRWLAQVAWRSRHP